MKSQFSFCHVLTMLDSVGLLLFKWIHLWCQNRSFTMHQRCLRVGKARSFSQGLSFMLVPMWLSSCGCRCSLLHLTEQGPIRALIKPIAMLCYLVPWMGALAVLHLLMNWHFVGCSHYRKSLWMLFPMLLVWIQELSASFGQMERLIGLALTP